MADHVRDAIGELTHEGRVVDLFSGMGSVAESLRDTASVVTNDALSFTATLSRARFTARQRGASPSATAARLRPAFDARLHELKQKYSEQLASEELALAGTRPDLVEYMQRALHVGNSAVHRRAARAAAVASTSARYELASLYFSAGYLSLHQAIEVDSIRSAIDCDTYLGDRDWLLGAWIAATSVLVNAPGHTAQFLRPNSASAHTRIARTWARSVWDEFVTALDTVALVGTEEWRSKNSVFVGDALELVSTGQLREIGTIY
ncbi:MAG: hypothetical protein WC558_16370, partial [Patulibacter sp.]